MTALPGPWRRLSALQIALLVSVALHAALLTLRFAAPADFERVFRESPLDVILVNTRSQDVPDKARAIAQTALAGGGSRAQGRATSPLPTLPNAATGDAAEDVARTSEQRQQPEQPQRTQLLAQLEQRIEQLSVAPPQPERSEEAQQQTAEAREQQRRRLIELKAEIERRIDDDSEGPKRRYVSPATREAVYAIYYDALRRRIEENGTLNFPQSGGRKLYGELTMLITIDARGRVLATDVLQSSGSAALDRRAEAIVRAAAPFQPFDAAMRAQAEQILVESRFRFTRDATLEARPTGS